MNNASSSGSSSGTIPKYEAGKLNDSEEVALDPHTVKRLNSVRKDIWAGGARGLCYGLLFGYACYHCAGYLPQLRRQRTKNHMVLAVLLGGSIGSFLGATVSGKNSVQHIGDVFRMNSRSGSAYRMQLNENERRVVESMDSSFESRREAILRSKSASGSIRDNSYNADYGSSARRGP